MVAGQKVICQWIALKVVDPQRSDALRQRYTYLPRLPYGAPKHARPAPIRLFQDAPGGYLCLPRDPALLRRLESLPDVTDAQCAAPSAPVLAFNGALDPARHQDRAVRAVMETLTTTRFGGGALLSLPTGYGKTACALYVTTQLARKIVVLVHTKILADQWVDRIQHFVQNARVSVITPQTYGNGPEEWTQHADYVVMLMQTLLSKASPAHRPFCEVFDMVMVDETHHLAARTLCRAMQIAGCRFRLGLSATLERKDGLHEMLEHLLGPLAFEVGRETNPNVVVHTYVYEPGAGNNPHDEDPSYAEALTQTAADPDRNRFVTKVIRQWYDRQKYMVVMSDRRSQLQALEALLQPHGLPILWAVGGGTSPDPVVVRQTRPIILATYGYCAEGMDIPDLDTCVLATSRCELRQCIGRILRQQGPGHQPVVCDVVDAGIRVLRRQAATRRKWFAAPLTGGGLAAFIVDEDT